MKFFISYRCGKSSIVGEVFEYLDSNGEFDVLAPNPSVSFHEGDVLFSGLAQPFDRYQIILAMSSALGIYQEGRRATCMLSLLDCRPGLLTLLPIASKSRYSPRISDYSSIELDATLLAHRNLFASYKTPHPGLGERLRFSKPHSMSGGLGLRKSASKNKLDLSISQNIILAGLRLDWKGAYPTTDPHPLEIDYCDMDSAEIDWLDAKFVLQMHSDSVVDGRSVLISAWRRPSDPLGSGIFFDAGGTDGRKGMMQHTLLPNHVRHGGWPSWLRFLFRFRIRKRRKTSNTYIYSMGKGANLKAFANRRFWGASPYRPLKTGMQSLGRLFVGSGRTSQARWELRQRAEELVRKRLAFVREREPPGFLDNNTVCALFRGNDLRRWRNGS